MSARITPYKWLILLICAIIALHAIKYRQPSRPPVHAEDGHPTAKAYDPPRPQKTRDPEERDP